MRSAFIYTLSDPLTGVARYVGQTVRPSVRLREHLRDAKNGCPYRCHRWIRKLTRLGLTPTFVIVETTTVSQADDSERRWIATLRACGADLTNHTDGGGGMSGYRLSDEARAKLRVLRLGNKSRTGQLQTDEEKEKRAASNRGKKRPPEFCARMREKATGVVHSEAAKLRMSQTKKATISPERRSEIARIANRASQEAKKCRSQNV